ncbi:MAG: M6 family metalloprotease domain-containing protein [Dysgonamonadaceae bacterium]|nr:M6 family metalloprotease domain-containing protein [Dysgonamonadaceae bacterium]
MIKCLPAYWVVLFFAFLIPQLSYAVPACPHPVQYLLPDGSFITLTLKGDEDVDWAVSPDGYTLLVNETGYYEYAEKNAAGNIILSGVRANNQEKRTVQEMEFLRKTPQNLRYSAEQLSLLRSFHDTRAYLRSASPAKVVYTGTVRAPLILVGFQDKPFTLHRNEFELLMNQPDYTAGGAITGSVYDYYYANSYGKLNYQVDVFGPYTLSHAIGYYDHKSGGNPREMAREAALKADADGCNFANYDIDGDNYVDGIHIIFAGYSQAAGAPKGNSIWSHAWEINAPDRIDGKYVKRYSCSPELRGNSGTNITYMGVIAHELGHVFGLPDFYDTDDEESGGETINTNSWDIMANGSWNDGGRTPANHTAYSKDFLGWLPAIELNEPANIILPNPALEDRIYKITTTTPNEYFLVENRQRIGWDAFIPASGMLVYHVDKNYSGWSAGKVNANPAHRGLYIKQAGGGVASNSANRTTDPYPATGNTSFTDTSTPDSKSWAGNNTGKPITNIVHSIGSRTVSFSFMGGVSEQKLVNAQVIPSNAGTVQGENYYTAGSTVTLTAIPAFGYRFSKWINGNTESTDNPYSFEVTDAVTLIAEFFPADVLEKIFLEDFEANIDAWTFVNDSQTNRWLRGGAIAHSGSKSVYISDSIPDGKEVYSYTFNKASKVHLFRDITFPALPNGHFRLDFDWKGRGEYPGGNATDYMEVRLIETTQMPVAGAALSSGILLGKFFGADWQHAAIDLPDNCASTSKRLAFTWMNDASQGALPPIAVDNIALSVVQPIEFTSPKVFRKKNKDVEVSTVSFTGIDSRWSALAPDWMILTPAQGSINNGNGQFTFSCKENEENSVREGIITLNAGGKIAYLKVIQAGKAPADLQAVFNETAQSVQLTWNPIVSESLEKEEKMLRWHNGVNGNASAYTNYEYVEVAIRFTPDDLAAYRGTKIRAIEIYARMIGTDMVLNIRQEGQIIYTQPIAGLQLNSFNRIDLAADIPIDISKELLVGYGYKQRSGTPYNYVLCRDPGPVVEGKNLYSLNKNAAFISYSSGNWNIALYVSRDNAPAYDVFRENERIAEAVTGTVFEDLHLPLSGDVCYTVSAVYNGDAALTSTASNTACVSISRTGMENVSGNNRSLFDISMKGNVPEVRSYARYSAIISLYGISGQLLYSTTLEAGETKNLDVELSRGVYLIKASCKAEGNSIKKIVVQ